MAAVRRFRYPLSGALCVIALCGASSAGAGGALEPLQANVTTLGPATIVTYHTSGPGGLAFVATAQVGEDGSAVPLRFATTLAPEQRVVISVPRAAGEAPLGVTFARIGDRLEVTRSALEVAQH